MSEKCVENYDRTLHQALSKIFRERCLTSAQIQEFVRSLAYENYATKLQILTEQEPVFSKSSCTKEEIGKLSLLWIAALAGYNDSAELLVRSGADVSELCRMCESLASLFPDYFYDDSLRDIDANILQVLLLKRPIPERLVRLVTEHGADLEARYLCGGTVLHHAVAESRIRITEMFLEKGANVNAGADCGSRLTPLLLAACRSNAKDEIMPLLMKYGADVFAKDKFDRNVLNCLSDYNAEYPELAKLLIEKGVPVDDCDDLQFRPLYLAVHMGKHELVKLYLDNGANVNAQTKSGASPLHEAALTLKRPIPLNLAILETLLKRGANIALTTTDGWTALHYACLHHLHSQEAIELLVSAGADVLVENDDGDTPLALLLKCPRKHREHPNIKLMIRMLALSKVRRPSIEVKDERIIKSRPKLKSYYRGCFEEIDRLKSTRFIETCTFYDLLVKSHRQIAALMRNPDFETEFGLYDLSEFPMYAEDVKRSFERAQNYLHPRLEQENVINEAVYGILPYLVVRKVVDYIFIVSARI